VVLFGVQMNTIHPLSKLVFLPIISLFLVGANEAFADQGITAPFEALVTSKSSRCAPSIICDNSVPLTLCKTYARDLSGTSQYNLYRLSDAHNDTDSFLAIAAFEYQRLDTKSCLSRRSNKPARRRSQRPLVSFFSLNNQERYSRIAPSLLANKAWQDLLLERFMRSQVDGNSEGSIRARSGDLKTFWQNASNRFDVSGDGRVSPIDLAQLIWFLNSDKHQAGQLPPRLYRRRHLLM